jgi:hypothetical protein
MADDEELYRKWHQEGKRHAGIILSPQIRVGELLKRLLRLLNLVSRDEMRDNLQYLSNYAERQKDLDPAEKE